MARPLRLEYEGAVYHITSRGNARQAIFLDDGDRRAFLEVLTEVVKWFRWLCYAYCLMDNHYHLLVETPEANLSRGMRQLNGVYTQRFNRRHGRVGHLFQGRYKAILVQKEAHLLELARYIVLNSVRAGLARDPGQWRWSSYRATSGAEQGPAFLRVDWLLEQFSPDREKAREAYRQFVAEGVGVQVWRGLKGGIFLGDDRFVEQLKGRLGRRASDREIPMAQRLAARPSLEELFADIDKDRRRRNRRIFEAVRSYG